MNGVNQQSSGRTQSNQSKKITIGLILSWIFGILFALIGIGFVFSELIPGLAMLVMAAVLLPPVNKLIENRWNFRLSKGIKIIVLTICFITWGVMINTSETPHERKTKPQKAEQRHHVTKEKPAPIPTKTKEISKPARPKVDPKVSILVEKKMKLQGKKAELENKYAELKNYKKKILELFKPSDKITKKYLDALKNNNRFEAYEYAKQGKSINFKIFRDIPSLKVPKGMKKANGSYELVAMWRKEAYGDVIKYFDNNYKLKYLSSYKENMNNAGVAQLSATGKLVVSIIKVEEKLREVKKQLKELEKESESLNKK